MTKHERTIKYYDYDGNIINYEKWSKLFEGRKLIQNEIEQTNFLVSTVYLGMDYGFDPEKPLIFETMVFIINNLDWESVDKYTRRYTTIDKAKKGHYEIIKILKDDLAGSRNLSIGK